MYSYFQLNDAWFPIWSRTHIDKFKKWWLLALTDCRKHVAVGRTSICDEYYPSDFTVTKMTVDKWMTGCISSDTLKRNLFMFVLELFKGSATGFGSCQPENVPVEVSVVKEKYVAFNQFETFL